MRMARITRFIVGVMVITCFMAVDAYAAGKRFYSELPENVKVVQKDNVDNITSFTTIQAASDAIRASQVEGPFMIRVMPGVYVGSVELPPNTSLVGSGKEVTRIIGTGDVAVSGNPLSIEDLSIESGNIGIRSTNYKLRNCRVSATKVGVEEASEVIDSEIIVGGSNEAGTAAFFATYMDVRVHNARIANTNKGAQSYAISTGNINLSIDDSVVEAVGSAAIYHEYWGSMSISDSTLKGPKAIKRGTLAGPTSISRSLLAGELDMGESPTAVVFSFDGNYYPIPNK